MRRWFSLTCRVHLAQRESGPDRIRELLKGFHAMVDKEAVSSGGMINSYLGDGG